MPSSIPDAEIYPEATGLAASIVAAHKDAAPLQFYAGWFCPFVQRCWIVLEEKKIPYQYIEINPYHKEASFLALNPRGLVPTLGCPVPSSSSSPSDTTTTTNGDSTSTTTTQKPLFESNIISDYLNSVYPNPPFYPTSSPYETARTRIWIDHITSRIIPAFHRFLQHTPSSPYSLSSARREFLGHLRTWIREAAPATQGPFWGGAEFGMADVCLAPWAVRLWVFDHFKEGGLGVPRRGEGGEDESTWMRWRVWLQAVEGRESVMNTLSDRERYLPIYQRYADDKAQSELAKATREGRGVP